MMQCSNKANKVEQSMVQCNIYVNFVYHKLYIVQVQTIKVKIGFA